MADGFIQAREELIESVCQKEVGVYQQIFSTTGLLSYSTSCACLEAQLCVTQEHLLLHLQLIHKLG